MSKNTLPLTAPRVAALRPPAKGRTFIHDAKLPGFGVEVSAAGSKSFYVIKRVGRQVVRRKVCGVDDLPVADARHEAARIIGQLASGQRVVSRTRAGGPTFGEAFESFIENKRRKGRKTWTEDRANFVRHLQPLENRRLVDITKADITALQSAIAANGFYIANRQLALIRSVFNFAIAEEMVDLRSPAAKVQMFPEKSRDRFLRPEEIERFVQALAKHGKQTRDYFMLLLLTGARKTDVASMRWDDIDLQLLLWTIGDNKTGGQQVPLIEPAVRILMTRERHESGFVFPSDKARAGYQIWYRRAWAEILKDAGIKNLRIHDLRRTMASFQAMGGANQFVIGQSLGHAPGSKVTSVYARLQNSAVRASMAAAAESMGISQEASHE